MPWDGLSDEQHELRDLVRSLARERIAPRAAEIDESHEFPWDVVELYREHGLFGLFFDEEYGGLGTGTLLALTAIEEVSKVCATSGLILAVQELGSLGLKLAGNDEQKERHLPKLASGEWLCAYALTESGSGSDSAAMRTMETPGARVTAACCVSTGAAGATGCGVTTGAGVASAVSAAACCFFAGFGACSLASSASALGRKWPSG